MVFIVGLKMFSFFFEKDILKCDFIFQVEQLECILSEKDKTIEDLSVSLQSVTENRDLLQAEYVEQASQLSQQVHILQEQLRQVRHVILFVVWPLVQHINRGNCI